MRSNGLRLESFGYKRRLGKRQVRRGRIFRPAAVEQKQIASRRDFGNFGAKRRVAAVKQRSSARAYTHGIALERVPHFFKRKIELAYPHIRLNKLYVEAVEVVYDFALKAVGIGHDK